SMSNSICRKKLLTKDNINQLTDIELVECLYDDFDERELPDICEEHQPSFFLKTTSDHPIGELRSFLSRLGVFKDHCPIFLNINNTINDTVLLAAEYGAAFIERYIAGIIITPDNESDIQIRNTLAWDLLQASGSRLSKIEFISCPGCGRTLYDLENTTKKIKKEFAHLDHLKIAIMGCIVNGPGEMVDADYGYIGAGNGKVTLYKGQTPVLKNIPEELAVEELKTLLKENNHWTDPK
ncbi:MAG: flavodoxin-dependent (E)-4-hydroxy-3-methylbut-2-enyl-diphosphate synthase, partial [Desulfovibrionales bacterium]|nr:flavodoxin-dependent (E)-4-hydroxy-3-methylbut-2-enyl-diphosphate synthase [Desulfovibrionales bacterium]